MAKFGEAISEAPVFVWADRCRDKTKAVGTALFSDVDEQGYLSFSYFSLPLRGSAGDRKRAHTNDDRMTMDTPVICRVVLQGMLIFQYMLMVVSLGVIDVCGCGRLIQ